MEWRNCALVSCHPKMAAVQVQTRGLDLENMSAAHCWFSSSPLTPSFYNLLCHSAHRTWDGDQVVAAKVDLHQCGNVTNGQRKLTEVIVGQVEASQARKPEKEKHKIIRSCERRDIYTDPPRKVLHKLSPKPFHSTTTPLCSSFTGFQLNFASNTKSSSILSRKYKHISPYLSAILPTLLLLPSLWASSLFTFMYTSTRLTTMEQSLQLLCSLTLELTPLWHPQHWSSTAIQMQNQSPHFLFFVLFLILCVVLFFFTILPFSWVFWKALID